MSFKIVQGWDDGVVNDFRLTALLRKYHAKATFYLNPGNMKDERQPARWVDSSFNSWNHLGFWPGKLSLKELLSVYDGFSVASHCWQHESSLDHTPEEYLDCALHARHFLEDLFQKPCPGFAWAGLPKKEHAQLLRDAGFAYGRTWYQEADITQCEDVMMLTVNSHFQDWNFYQKYEAARKTGVFYFWGHSYEMLETQELWDQFEAKLRYIASDPEAEWAEVLEIVPLCQKEKRIG